MGGHRKHNETGFELGFIRSTGKDLSLGLPVLSDLRLASVSALRVPALLTLAESSLRSGQFRLFHYFSALKPQYSNNNNNNGGFLYSAHSI